MRVRLLGIGFLAPALVAVSLFFLLPVLLTAVFSFTNMSTSTGISGGEYLIIETDLRDLPAQGVSAETVVQLDAAGYAITEVGLARMAAAFGADRAQELREDYFGDTFEARRDLERLLRDLDNNPIRNTRERKAAADLFAVTIVGERYDTEAAFRDALSDTGIDPSDHDALVTAAYTGWIWTSDNFSLLFELPSTLRYALNTAFYVVCTLAFNITFGLFLAISTFYLPLKLANVFRSIWFLPRILPPVMYVLMWNWFTWDNGFIATVTGWFGVPQQNWMMQTPTHAWTVIILINGFVGASLGMILFSSAIKAIPLPMLYASEVDGANRWQQVRYIILPQMRWPILFLTCYQTLSLLTSFEYILLATDGGPGSTTEVWALAAYHTALSNYGGNLQYGLGAAFALILVVIGIVLSALYLRFFNFKELVAKPRIEQ
ncbi:carbohydrate ABC transporter permease [Rhodophyticola porphyridii]|uniref:Sugar ABC transporter permease n=1 Tax=Rhodophyticola porphyridii TaxID=1852017 RepID=A0A3L9Y711_9RHOB|nr:sugar ABC transporter permease [Rhodophyticola porphyridii]RMA43068.1 sugar ABC transporter permease [Rhodophyticola porphyridii]